MDELKECGGCGEIKPAAEFKTSLMDDYVCASCQVLDAKLAEYTALVNEASRLEDEYYDCTSEGERMEVSARLYEVRSKIFGFDWNGEESE